MAFDVKEKIDELVKKVKGDPQLMAGFQKDPVKTIEGLLNIDLPDEQLKPLVAGIQTKLAASQMGDKLEGLKKLF